MCGIVGIFLKDQALAPQLGSFMATMLSEMSERGPDSAGIAIYRNPVEDGAVKVTLSTPAADFPWDELAAHMESALTVSSQFEIVWNHAVLTVRGNEQAVLGWLEEYYPDVRVTSVGTHIEIFKEQGRPRDVAEGFRIADFGGSHAVGHTRMATESAVSTEHSHPFSTGLDLCLVHNGSLSNHNRLRRKLNRQGVKFQTDNDSEVAAGFFTMKLRQGLSLREALQAGLVELDGFYTFAVGTKDGFAVLRDSVACKPAVIAETDRWVGIASEYRALAHLPDASTARIWEPEPAVVYAWNRD